MGYVKPLACSKLMINYHSPQFVEIWWGGFLTEKGLGESCILFIGNLRFEDTADWPYM